MRTLLQSLFLFSILLQICFGQEEQNAGHTVETWRGKLTPTSHELIPSFFQLENSPEIAAQLAPELIALLSNKNETVQFLAVRTLRKAGPAASPAIDSLIPMLNHTDHTFRIEVMETLKAIGPVAVPKLNEALNSVNPRTKSHSLSVRNQVESEVLGKPATDVNLCMIGEPLHLESRSKLLHSTI
jgi:hypothetical protein